MKTLKTFLQSNPSNKTIKITYEDGQQVRLGTVEVHTILYDRSNKRIFVNLPNSMKREEVT